MLRCYWGGVGSGSSKVILLLLPLILMGCSTVGIQREVVTTNRGAVDCGSLSLAREGDKLVVAPEYSQELIDTIRKTTDYQKLNSLVAHYFDLTTKGSDVTDVLATTVGFPVWYMLFAFDFIYVPVACLTYKCVFDKQVVEEEKTSRVLLGAKHKDRVYGRIEALHSETGRVLYTQSFDGEPVKDLSFAIRGVPREVAYAADLKITFPNGACKYDYADGRRAGEKR